MSLVLAFDPGDTTGICLMKRANAEVVEIFQLPLDEFMVWINTPHDWDDQVSVVVYERYIVYRQKAAKMVGSKNKASQAIGAIKSYAIRNKIAKIVEQQANILTPAKASSGIVMPSDHRQTHRWDAFLHGWYYLWAVEGNVSSGQKGLAGNGS